MSRRKRIWTLFSGNCNKKDLAMYSINKHFFKEFKIAPGHRANYAILCNPEFKENQWGIKYHPSNNYAREYKVLSQFSHPQIPARYQEGTDVDRKSTRLNSSHSQISYAV